MILSLKIALKFHKGSSNNILISLMSVISVLSIAIGIAVSIIALSVVHGFKYELSKRILVVIPHGEIKPIDKSFIDWKRTLICIKKIPNVIHASPYVHCSGIVQFCDKWHLIYIKSIDIVENSMEQNELYHFVINEDWKRFYENENQILLGKGVSDSLNIKVGDWVTILITSNDVGTTKKMFSFKRIYMQVAGIINLHSQLDRNLAVMSLLNIQRYSNNKISDITGISIRVNDVFNIKKVISKIRNMITDRVEISSWMDEYGYVYRDIQMMRIIIYLSMILIMGIFCFNVVATSILMIKNKIYDVAILRVLGARINLIKYVFFWHGLIMYIISSIIGVIVGVVVALNITNLSMKYSNFLKKNIFLEGVYFIDFLPSKLNVWDIFIMLSITLFLGTLVSWCISSNTKNVNLFRMLK